MNYSQRYKKPRSLLPYSRINCLLAFFKGYRAAVMPLRYSAKCSFMPVAKVAGFAIFPFYLFRCSSFAHKSLTLCFELFFFK